MRILALSLVCGVLAACGGTVSTGAPGSGDGDAAALGFARFADIPMPANNSIDLGRTLVLGSERAWTGRLAISSGSGVGDLYEFYRREMPKYGWVEFASVRSASSFLAFQQEGRIATLQLTPRTLTGSAVDLVMAPAAPGVGMTASAPSMVAPAAGAGVPALPRGGVEQSPLPRR
jgi:hypothetical protein